MKSVYVYADFKVLLKDLLKEFHDTGSEVTYEELGRRVGFTSKGFVTQIIQGKSKIPDQKIRLFAVALGLKKKEQDYFEILVRYNQAKTNQLKNELFAKLTNEFKTKIKHLGPDRYEFYSTWYYSAIRSMLSYYPFTGDYKALAAELIPAITPTQAKKAISLLEKLSLIQKQDDGLYTVTDRMLSTGETADVFTIVNYQKSTIGLTKESLDVFKKSDRSSATLTLGLSEEGYRKVKEKIDAIRRELMEIANYDHHIDRVIQVNLHAFPLSKQYRGQV